MAAASIKQSFFIQNIGLLGVGAPNPAIAGAPPIADQQGVNLTAVPVPTVPNQPQAAGLSPVQIPILDPAAKSFFSVGDTIECTIVKTVAPAAGAVAGS